MRDLRLDQKKIGLDTRNVFRTTGEGARVLVSVPRFRGRGRPFRGSLPGFYGGQREGAYQFSTIRIRVGRGNRQTLTTL